MWVIKPSTTRIKSYTIPLDMLIDETLDQRENPNEDGTHKMIY